jgi:hypothetical protein
VSPLAYADSTDTTNASIAILVISTGILIAAVAAAMVPICIARSRRILQSDALVPLAIVWALTSAVVSIYAYIAQSRWKREYLLRIQSGYFDPRDLSDAPVLPWTYWYVLGAMYLLLILWAMSGKQRSKS